ncbi:AMPLIFIED IN BREAST CANCER 2-RELATED [Salix viminalis]|uniref:Nonsense-mediated mRNA decay factor SMG8 n=1 Tax=Salix viminalis TaxID=40686 RepID=A0A9Q0QKG6_SALVM|nr:AMPLIFIED IN BREAST CANCER 2-RELATED [Salix viminalis]
MVSRNPNTPSMRVLTRPPTPSPIPIPTSSPDPQPSSQSHPRSLEGVVVVGILSRNPNHSTHLINRVLDSNAFGSGHLDKALFADKDEVKDWLKKRRISYYHEEEKGFLFLQFCSTPIIHGFSNSGSGLEELEFEELQGLLFMFSEGTHFDTHVLQKLRILQASKHALSPYVRSRIISSLSSRPQSLSSSSRLASSTGSSPGRSGFISRDSSSVSIMSGLGSYASLFPGYCTPVMLFVFVDDFLEGMNSGSNVESTDSSSLNQSSGLSSVARPNAPAKGSGSVVVLARPLSKSEGGFKKKLQSSLEAQIRFLIKKCRTLSGFESSHNGSRTGAVSSTAPLFSLDASRSVVLLDRSANLRGESLEFATNLVEDEFIYRQSDILRGKGGLATGTNSGSAAGVGMVAVAAAAAAASASAGSGKTLTASELPSLEIWLSSSQLILYGILSAKHVCIDETEVGKRKPRQRNTGSAQIDGASRVIDPPDIAVSLLENSRGLNRKFSTSWCVKALPTAKDEYLKGLPVCYPTAQHEAHLEKAMRVFLSMVRGPAVPVFAKKLEDECSSVWRSGRQLCDAVSLTGKPCMQVRHSVDNSVMLTGAPVKPHSSGYFFLHACACGRSRQLLSDPFDFESANISSNCFTDCDKHLPAIQLPEGSNIGPIQSSSWSLIRSRGCKLQIQDSLLCSTGNSTCQFLRKVPRKTGGDIIEWGRPKVGQASHKSEDISSVQEILHGKASNGGLDGDPFLQIGSNVVPMNSIGGEVVKSSKDAIIYVGFEHECPHGHRFLLSLDHLNELGSLYSLPEESHLPSVETSDNSLANPSNLGRNSGTGKGRRSSKDKAVATANKLRNTDKSKEMGVNGNLSVNELTMFSGSGKEHKLTSLNVPTHSNFTKYLDADLVVTSLDDGGSAFSMLNRNLPMYMNCPYCQLSKNKKDPQKVKFAGTVSQMQRIFLVTPPFPVVLATCPVIQFAASCLPPSVSDRDQKLQFSLGCQVVLPPESFLTLRLPFVYGVQVEDGNPVPLNAFETQPEMTAWIMKGTTLQLYVVIGFRTETGWCRQELIHVAML